MSRSDPGAPDASDALRALASPRWTAIRLQHLIALETVARSGSFVRAASALGYSQSAISQQVATLEGIAGARLLMRGDGLAPTRAGEVVLRHARVVRRQFASLDEELGALKTPGCAGRVATHHPASTWLLADALRSTAGRSGSGPLLVTVASSVAALLQGLDAGSSDLALAVVPPVPDAGIVVEPLAEWPIGVVSSASAPRPPRQRALIDLSGSRLLCVSECPATERLLRELADRGIPHEVSVRADDSATLLELARRGDGVALLPRLSGDGAGTGLVRDELAERFAVVVSAVWCADRSPAGECAQILALVRAAAARRSAGH